VAASVISRTWSEFSERREEEREEGKEGRRRMSTNRGAREHIYCFEVPDAVTNGGPEGRKDKNENLPG